jgi:prefoldin subunit 5
MLTDDEFFYLDSRIAIIENAYLGRNTESVKIESLQAKFEEITKKLIEIEKAIPNVTHCHTLIQSITPILTMNRSQIDELLGRAQELLAQKDDLLNTINSLQTVKTLSPLINQENYDGNI